MKKILLTLLIISAIAITTVVNFTSAQAQVQESETVCILHGNGCWDGSLWWPFYKEAIWPE